MTKRNSVGQTLLTLLFILLGAVYILPILQVLNNSFKYNAYVNTDTFSLPDGESFAGWDNYLKGLTFGNYPFVKSALYSLLITVASVALILLCTSMAAWYIV
ncbi:MAG: carbohydrate ABC transporter permease, partial [Lachnospiraceae bacterium]|nr:carbohydrate ABC transporter permease [Lachnospiraceae bacterium]